MLNTKLKLLEIAQILAGSAFYLTFTELLSVFATCGIIFFGYLYLVH